ncbi:copper resistance CopC family protein [Halostreptopolyspora alba]|uniref:Copper resistance protein CopC n=1 Tax=Halostreptopolyspora alba TaxID=2487137 RepID=A0A3N0E7P6_9ACTN|nr:copper resistance protein CopC [Nocardiopsaceae bacterium YIM 96095]
MHTPPTVRRLAALVPATGAALLLGVATAPAALAHNTLISSSPEADEELDSAPDEVTLTFSDEVQTGGDSANTIVVTGPEDQTYEEGDVRVDGETASIDLRPLEAAGEHTIAYRIISADGHPVEDEFGFTLTGDGVAEQSGSQESDQANGGSGGGEAEADDEGGAEEPQDAASDPMSTYGPIGGVVAAIAVVALLVILLVRMRGRTDHTPPRE